METLGVCASNSAMTFKKDSATRAGLVVQCTLPMFDKQRAELD